MNKHTELTAKIEELIGNLEEDAIFEFERNLFQTFSDALIELRRLAEIEQAAIKVIKCKGRYHTEQNMRELARLLNIQLPKDEK
jgi:hypothetical protein